VIHATPLLHQLQWLPMQQRITQVNSSDVSLQDSQHSSTPVYPFSRIIESACSRTLPSRCWSNRSQDRLFLPCFLVFSTVSPELAAVNSPDQRLFVNVYRASAYNACIARYCYGKSVRLSACLSNASSVSKRIDTSSHFLTFWMGHHLSFISSPTAFTNSKENPISGDIKYTAVREFCNYRPLSCKQNEIDP